jgi:hypothetical protein
VRIGLVADVPDQSIARRVEQVVERDRELDDTETRAEMASGDRHGIDGFLPELGRKLYEVRLGKRAQVLRRRHAVKQRRLHPRRCIHLSPAPFYLTLNPG